MRGLASAAAPLEIEKERRRDGETARRRRRDTRTCEGKSRKSRRGSLKVQSSFRLTAYLIKTTLSRPAYAVKRRPRWTVQRTDEPRNTRKKKVEGGDAHEETSRVFVVAVKSRL